MANGPIAWGTKHPGLLILLVDLSGSMAWDNKLKRVGSALYKLSYLFVQTCWEKNKFLNRLHTYVIGYNQYTYDIFHGNVEELAEVVENAEPEEDFFSVYRDKAKAQGLTHMAMAYDEAGKIIDEWVQKQMSNGISVPYPVVINITDGFPEENGLSDEESRNKALSAARRLMSKKGSDANVKLFNIHIDGKPGETQELILPSERPSDARRGFLFDASSELDDDALDIASKTYDSVRRGSRYMVSNVSNEMLLAELIKFGSAQSFQELRETPIS